MGLLLLFTRPTAPRATPLPGRAARTGSADLLREKTRTEDRYESRADQASWSPPCPGDRSA